MARQAARVPKNRGVNPPGSTAQGVKALGDAAAWPVQGLIRHFRHEIEKRIDDYAANPHSEPVRVAAE